MADYATLLRDHVTLSCRCVDRIFLQGYVAKLQTVGWVCEFLNRQCGFVIPSSAAFGKIGAAYVAEVHRWAEANGVPVVHFAKGENKEQIARPLLAVAEAAGGDGQVVLIGIAQEKAPPLMTGIPVAPTRRSSALNSLIQHATTSTPTSRSHGEAGNSPSPPCRVWASRPSSCPCG